MQGEQAPIFANYARPARNIKTEALRSCKCHGIRALRFAIPAFTRSGNPTMAFLRDALGASSQLDRGLTVADFMAIKTRSRQKSSKQAPIGLPSATATTTSPDVPHPEDNLRRASPEALRRRRLQEGGADECRHDPRKDMHLAMHLSPCLFSSLFVSFLLFLSLFCTFENEEEREESRRKKISKTQVKTPMSKKNEKRGETRRKEKQQHRSSSAHGGAVPRSVSFSISGHRLHPILGDASIAEPLQQFCKDWPQGGAHLGEVVAALSVLACWTSGPRASWRLGGLPPSSRVLRHGPKGIHEKIHGQVRGRGFWNHTQKVRPCDLQNLRASI